MRPSWGEPYRSIAARVIAAMNDAWETAPLLDDGSEGDVVIVSHQLPIWIVHRFAGGRPPLRTTRGSGAAHSRASPASAARRHLRGDRLSEPAASISANAVDLGAV